MSLDRWRNTFLYNYTMEFYLTIKIIMNYWHSNNWEEYEKHQVAWKISDMEYDSNYMKFNKQNQGMVIEIRVTGFIGKELKRTSGGKTFYILVSQKPVIFTLKICTKLWLSIYLDIFLNFHSINFKLIKYIMILISCFNGFLSFSDLTEASSAQNKIDSRTL